MEFGWSDLDIAYRAELRTFLDDQRPGWRESPQHRRVVTAEEKAGCAYANRKLALAITPYFFNLIDRHDADCPIRKQVIPRAGLPEDIAAAALFLASDEAGFVNGEDIVVDGGLIWGRRYSETMRGGGTWANLLG